MTSSTVIIDISDPRARRLAEAMGSQRTRSGVIMTENRVRKWRLLIDSGFDVSKTLAAGQRPGFVRRNGPKLLLSEAVMVSEAIAETRQECARQEAERHVG